LSEYDWNAAIERGRQRDQPQYADEIKQSLVVGFHLVCLRCGAGYYHTRFTMSELSYRMYSYCPNCIEKAIELLLKTDKEGLKNDD